MHDRDPLSDDLTAWALGALDGEDADRVVEAAAGDPRRAAELAAIRAHLAAYDALEDAPPAPPFARIEAAIHRATPVRRRWIAWAAAAALLLGVGIAWRALQEQASPTTPELPAPELHTVVFGSGWRDSSPGPTSVVVGAPRDLEAVRTAELRWQSGGRGIHVIAEQGSVVRLDHPEQMTLVRGRAWCEVEPARTLGAADVVVVMGAHRVRVVGTVFELDADAPSVGVERGRVEVDGRAVEAGRLWRAGEIRARPPGPLAWLPRPELLLRAEKAISTARNAPREFALSLRNPSDVTVRLPRPGGNRTGLWMEWLDKAGSHLQSLSIGPGHLVAGRAWLEGGSAWVLPPGAERTIRIRFRTAQGPPGAYRCRALIRPAGTAPVLSNPLLLEGR